MGITCLFCLKSVYWAHFEKEALMVTLLVINYLCFISLGLPNPIMGAAWPVMRLALEQPEEALGPVSMVMVLGTVIASLISSRMIKAFGTGKVVTAGVLVSGLSVLLLSYVNAYLALFLLMIPLGLASGTIDAAINGFIARHYQAIHMNWLHCMWGLGAAIGPMIIGAYLNGAGGWAAGFRTVAFIQLTLGWLLVLTLPIWRRAAETKHDSDQEQASGSLVNVMRLPGMGYAMAALFCFVGFESLVGVWAGSYLADAKGFEPSAASMYSSLFFIGITIGRFVTGVIALKMDSKTLIRLGGGASVIAALLLTLPLPRGLVVAALLLLGLGSAPLFPAMAHLTPTRFGQENSQAALGLLMAAGFLGGALAPPFTSLVVSLSSLIAIPWVILALALPGFWFSQRIDQSIPQNS